ncbi:hypothetical protein BC829DRAFT_438981 [Chytridium lagenaria]|nr:hypothetical protein BC829DRAFT_438981 [Chytridium lagenaria]
MSAAQAISTTVFFDPELRYCDFSHSRIDLKNTSTFTDLPAAPLARLLVSTSLSNNLTHLNLSGCFNATSGPAVLDILSRGLFRLVQLDLSHCDWASEDAIMSMSWDSVGVICFPFLEVLVMRECPVVERPMGANLGKFRGEYSL